MVDLSTALAIDMPHSFLFELQPELPPSTGGKTIPWRAWLRLGSFTITEPKRDNVVQDFSAPPHFVPKQAFDHPFQEPVTSTDQILLQYYLIVNKSLC